LAKQATLHVSQNLLFWHRKKKGGEQHGIYTCVLSYA